MRRWVWALNLHLCTTDPPLQSISASLNRSHASSAPQVSQLQCCISYLPLPSLRRQDLHLDFLLRPWGWCQPGLSEQLYPHYSSALLVRPLMLNRHFVSRLEASMMTCLIPSRPFLREVRFFLGYCRARLEC